MGRWRRFRGLWIGIIFTFVGTIFALVGIAFSVRSISQSGGTADAAGIVTALEARETSSSPGGGRYGGATGRTTVYTPVVRYEVEGRAYSTKSVFASSGNPYQVGDKIPVLYRIAQPSVGYVNTFTERWLIPLAFTFLGTLFAVIGIAVLFVAKNAFCVVLLDTCVNESLFGVNPCLNHQLYWRMF